MQNPPQVTPEQLQKAREYVAKHRHINWYSDPYQLDESAIVEGILNYGTWEDFKVVFSLFRPLIFKDIFADLINPSRMRINIRPRTIHFFNKYLEKHA